MNCPKCGSYITEDDLFCGCCGYKNDCTQSRKSVSKSSKKKQSLKASILFLFLSSFLVIALLIVNIYINNTPLVICPEPVTQNQYSSSYEFIESETVEEVVSETYTYSTTRQSAQVNDSELESLINLYDYGLEEENRMYEVTLDESDWNISFRSTPEIDESMSNFICNIKDGTNIEVKYIYNGTWALFKYKGKWGFASIYASANINGKRIMTPIY